ncbi:hypothetical protein [Pontivivens insulae]|uniref:Uncharacterized protein n=1 Tax=Pontivivens insulae TaxID=1639689 RepID=A0A2R8A9W6_9RHOB|nr:hypothetical protein [Pontivivens insulae]RED12928.1 hypothetical protein DFR53_2062 [Pontivivens insulae]SPF29021.1 hypothetical protein POI8812_01326 [Pontivivens insulae]
MSMREFEEAWHRNAQLAARVKAQRVHAMRLRENAKMLRERARLIELRIQKGKTHEPA